MQFKEILLEMVKITSGGEIENEEKEIQLNIKNYWLLSRFSYSRCEISSDF